MFVLRIKNNNKYVAFNLVVVSRPMHTTSMLRPIHLLPARLTLKRRPGRAFSITCVSKLSVVALRKKKQSIALDEYSRLVVYFFPRSIFDLVMSCQMSIFGEIDVFSTLQDNSDGAMADVAMKPLPSCSVDN